MLVAQIAPTLQRVIRTCGEPLLQIGRERVEFAGLGTPRRPLRKCISNAIATYGVAAQVELGRDNPIAQALGTQFPHLFILHLATRSTLRTGRFLVSER